jgi:hypothetical protein
MAGDAEGDGTMMLSVQEVAELLMSMGKLPKSEREARRYVEDWIEHMRAGGFSVGRD